MGLDERLELFIPALGFVIGTSHYTEDLILADVDLPETFDISKDWLYDCTNARIKSIETVFPCICAIECRERNNINASACRRIWQDVRYYFEPPR